MGGESNPIVSLFLTQNDFSQFSAAPMIHLLKQIFSMPVIPSQ